MTYSISDLEEVTPLEIGRTNVSYILDFNGSKSVLRISKEKSQKHIIDRAFEQEVFIQASNANLAPVVISTGKNFIVTQYYDNQSTRDAMASIEMIVPTLLSFHNTFSESLNAPVFEDVLRQRMRLVREGTKNIPDKYWELESAALKIIQSPEYLSFPRTLCHLDLTPRNILFGEDHIKFIDFEMANYGPQLLDFASLSVGYGLNDEEDKELLGLYYDNSPFTQGAYYTAKFCYHFRCVLWLLIQQQIETNSDLQKADLQDLGQDIEKCLFCLNKITLIEKNSDYGLLPGPGNSGPK